MHGLEILNLVDTPCEKSSDGQTEKLCAEFTYQNLRLLRKTIRSDMTTFIYIIVYTIK